MAMRNIAQDIRERLEEIAAERRKLQLRLDDLVKMESGLKILLQQEESRWSALSASSSPSPEIPESQILKKADNGHIKSPLSNLLLEALADHKPKSNTELTQFAVARGYPFGAKKPKQSVNFAMVALSNAGKVRRDKAAEQWVLLKEKGEAR
jgi:hypothetical protein